LKLLLASIAAVAFAAFIWRLSRDDEMNLLEQLERKRRLQLDPRINGLN